MIRQNTFQDNILQPSDSAEIQMRHECCRHKSKGGGGCRRLSCTPPVLASHETGIAVRIHVVVRKHVANLTGNSDKFAAFQECTCSARWHHHESFSKVAGVL